MKVIFVCGCLEPGKDGVGDYTRRLACGLISQNVQVGIIAINDGFLGEYKEELQLPESFQIPTLRIPKVYNDTTKIDQAKKWVDTHNPEWLSLQFVPYSFHTKGLPFQLRKQLNTIGGSKKWHIMIHELWIGMNIESSFKTKSIGKIQKILIKKY